MQLTKLQSKNTKYKTFPENLVCPQCHCKLTSNNRTLVCKQCNRNYPITNGIVDFREKDAYWCNVSREKMEQLNNLAKTSGDWLGAAEKIVPQYAGHFKPFYRADSQFLWPCTKDSRILDAGSMWGGITIPAAQFHGQVYAVDQTVETLEFLDIRAEQMGFNNIYTIACGLRKLPFPDDFFDLVVLNGVLEWVALQQEVILERHWKKFGRGLRPEESTTYLENPTTMQLKVLREIQRILKPGGCLYLAIENRFGYIYLAGWPDDHMNVPFICFMPRPIANAITKLFLKCEYRTYVYSIPGYKSLLKQSHFGKIDFYGAFTHYIRPSEIVPLDLIKRLKDKIVSTKSGIHKTLLRFVPKVLLKWLAPSVIAIAVKGPDSANNKPRLIQLLEKAGLLSSSPSKTKVVKCNSRLGNDQTVNYFVCEGNKNKPKYFCKVCRSVKDTDVLKTEARNLEIISQKLKNSKLTTNIPKLLYFGTIDNITFMVMEYKSSKFNHNRRLRTKLKDLDQEIKTAIEFLTEFQRHTQTTEVDAAVYLNEVIETQRTILENDNLLTRDTDTAINNLQEELHNLKGVTMPLCAQHGDYDFFHNILFNEKGIKVVDFEHFQQEALPFLDLATLIFNPILLSCERQKNKMPMHTLLNKYNLNNYIRSWFDLYARLSGLPKELLQLVPPLAALEQKTKQYPDYREPETFPINTAFEEFLTLRI